MTEFVQQLQPFPDFVPTLRNIVTGIKFPLTVNAHKAKEVTMKSDTLTTKEGKSLYPN